MVLVNLRVAAHATGWGETMWSRWLAFLNRLLTVNAQDSDTRRRGRLLGILLLSTLLAVFLLTAINLFDFSRSLASSEAAGTPFAVLIDVAIILFLVGLLFLNRSGRTRWAGYSFLTLYVVVISSSFGTATLDRVLLTLTIPTLAASFLVSPASSFLFALLSTVSYTLFYLFTSPPQSYSYVSIMGLFMISVVSWLAAANLEGALRDIHQALAREHAAQGNVTRLNEDLERRTRELSALNAAGRAMVSTLNSEAVLKLMIDEVRRLLDAEGASVMLRDPASPDDDLVFAAAAGLNSETLVGTRMPATTGIAGWVMRERQSAVVSDVRRDSRFYDQVDSVTGQTTRSVVAVPLMFKGAMWGAVEAVNKAGGVFGERDREILEALASSAAIAIENARLYETEREQFRRLKQTQAQLVQVEKMAALGRLLASISHEINNPLQAIQNSLELAGDELEGSLRPDKLTRYVGIAGKEVERLAAIVRRMRDFYRPAREGLQPTDAHAVLQSVLELADKQLQHSHVTVECEWAMDLPDIPANPDYLKQVFLNLVLNAIDAMAARGAGTLRVRTTVCEMQQRNNRAVPAVCIEFGDTGDGMSPEVIAHLFEPFVTTKSEGTGLGLSISYGLIEAHNGQITAMSQAGVGTTFTILLPVSEA